jgi:hypothetical protein
MRVAIHEYDKAFGIDIDPETLADAALLVRFGTGARREGPVSISVNAWSDGTMHGWIRIEKRKRGIGDVKP